MSHVRQQIRDAIVTQLAAAGTDASTRVYSAKSMKHEVLPDIDVWTLKDTVNHDMDIKGAKEFHELEISIEIRAKAAEDLCDDLDDICSDVETEMMKSTVTDPITHITTQSDLYKLIKYIQLENTEIQFEDEDKKVGLATITFTALYRISKGSPETAV